jgi:hypothetical protein
MMLTIAAALSIALSAALSAAPAGNGNVAPRCAEPVAPASDYMYTFSTSEESESKSTGTVRAHGDRIRIDMDKKDSKQGSRDYLILTNNGTRLLSVHPDKQEVSQISSSDFERIIGTSLRAVSPMVKFHVLNSKISTDRVATGQKLLGYATEQVRMTERFDIHIVAMGFDGGTEHHTVITDYWVSPGLDLGSNPLITLFEHIGTAMAQTDRDFVQNELDARSQAVGGTPLRTVIKESSTDDKGIQHTKTRSIEITSVKIGPQQASLFEVPAGYKTTKGMNVSM